MDIKWKIEFFVSKIVNRYDPENDTENCYVSWAEHSLAQAALALADEVERLSEEIKEIREDKNGK